MTALDQVLDHLGYEHRPQQDRLFEVLRDNQGAAVVQAGTGTGKSIAVLAAAAWRSKVDIAGDPAIVVVPTNILMQQYVDKDAPAVEEALGVKIRSLKGRSHYLCASSPGMRNDPITEYTHHLLDTEPFEVVDSYYGCPGSDVCKYDLDDPAAWPCQYRVAKEALADAEVIITNAHLLIIDTQLKSLPEPVAIFPDYCALFVDEAHTLEEVARGFTESSVSVKVAEGMGLAGRPFVELMDHLASMTRSPLEITDAQVPHLVHALTPLSRWVPPEGSRGKQTQWDTREAARKVLADGATGVYQARQRVLWLDPRRHPARPRLAGTAINLAPMLGAILGRVPTALVSATIPSTLRQACGISEASFLDVGHPFDYSRQARLGFSSHSAAYKVGDQTAGARADELLRLIEDTDGGVLLLFSAFKDLIFAVGRMGPVLRAQGRNLYVQEDGVDKADLTRRFKADGRGVLFGSASFATGFDVPGPALRGVGIWKLPYPGLDPVTRAISDVSRKRYEDMMLVAVTQAIGRLIRTRDDDGWVWVADQRGIGVLMGRQDPMVNHLREFQRLVL